MNLDTSQIKPLVHTVADFFKKYAVVLFIVLGIAVLSFLVYQVGSLASKEPPESLVEEKTGEARPIRIDSRAVEQVQQLQATNIEVKALFNQSRDNPFTE